MQRTMLAFVQATGTLVSDANFCPPIIFYAKLVLLFSQYTGCISE